jgi:hypothetical protein
MAKPTVFLSHSSKDKEPLGNIKNLLNERAAGSLRLFLSSDGQSIPFGTNWVVQISDALKDAKLMFVFLSPASLSSNWIHFEAGNAYANGVSVVPVCLPGLDHREMTPPLSLLQGFNLHSSDSLSVLARKCNETFDLELREDFEKREFDELFTGWDSVDHAFFGRYSLAVDSVSLASELSVEGDGDASRSALKLNLLTLLKQVADKASVDCRIDNFHRLEMIGGLVYTQTDSSYTTPAQRNRPGVEKLSIRCNLSTSMVHVLAPILDEWHTQANFPNPWRFMIQLKQGIRTPEHDHDLTAAFFKSGIKFHEHNRLVADGLEFTLDRGKIYLEKITKLDDRRIGNLLRRFFEIGALVEVPYTPFPEYA